MEDATHKVQHHEEGGEAPASEVSLSEDLEAKSSSSASSSSSSSSSAVATGGIDAQGSWGEWIEEKKKEYGSPNDWVDSNPTAKQYQQAANEFFKGIGQWGHEKALAWFPTYYNYEEPTRPVQQQREEDASRADLA